MSFQSLIAHNGVNHQKSSPAEKPKQSSNKTQHEDIKHNSNDAQIVPESSSAFEKQVLETPKTTVSTERKIESITTIETPYLSTATLVPGFGESIFTLLIASPFFLFGLKKWLHK